MFLFIDQINRFSYGNNVLFLITMAFIVVLSALIFPSKSVVCLAYPLQLLRRNGVAVLHNNMSLFQFTFPQAIIKSYYSYMNYILMASWVIRTCSRSVRLPRPHPRNHQLVLDLETWQSPRPSRPYTHLHLVWPSRGFVSDTSYRRATPLPHYRPVSLLPHSSKSLTLFLWLRKNTGKFVIKQLKSQGAVRKLLTSLAMAPSTKTLFMTYD